MSANSREKNTSMKIHNCSGCIGLYKDKLLFIKNTKGEVVLIKGHIKEKESPRMAAKREFQEETGYFDFQISKRKICNLTYTRTGSNGNKEKFIIRIYLAKLNSLKKIPKSINEDTKLQNILVSFLKAEQLLTYKNVVRIIKKIKGEFCV